MYSGDYMDDYGNEDYYNEFDEYGEEYI